VLDFAAMSAGKVPPAFASAAIRPMTPPHAGSHATYGEWPNQRSQARVPANGSLVGEHVVRGNYTPDIRFTLGHGQDFLAPVMLNPMKASASGAMPLSWRPVAGAKAWLATTMGAAENGDFILWSSSEVQAMAMALDYVRQEDLARLVQQKLLLPASADRCTIPAEVVRAAPEAMLRVIAFGGEANFSHPARPAGGRPEWTVKVRTRSVHSGILGMDMNDLTGDGDEDEAYEEDEEDYSEERPARSRLKKGLGVLLGN
jgi:hypothetical protein